MNKATLIVASALLALLIGTGVGKIKRVKPIRHNLRASEVPRKWWSPLGTLELLGAAGIVVGLIIPPLGILTSICLVLYFAGAVGAHVRAQDPNVLPSGSGMILSIVLAKLLLDRQQEEASEF